MMIIKPMVTVQTSEEAEESSIELRWEESLSLSLCVYNGQVSLEHNTGNLLKPGLSYIVPR